MKKYKNIVFDLDGTLTDSSVGIMNGFRHTFRALNYPIVDDAYLKPHIGAPLLSTFSKYFFKEDPGLVEQAVRLYREYYSEKGKFENELYPGVVKTLSRLKKNYNLYVLTNKPHAFAVDIIQHFKLDPFFKSIHGIDPLTNITKDIHALELNKTIFEGEQHLTVIVGDTIYDMECAAKAGWKFCFVTYGYGGHGSLGGQTPDCVVFSFQQLTDIF